MVKPPQNPTMIKRLLVLPSIGIRAPIKKEPITFIEKIAHSLQMAKCANRVVIR